MFVNTEPVEWEEHQSWYEGALKSSRKMLLIIHQSDDPICMIRFDLDKDRSSCRVSINMNPEHRGKGLSAECLHEALESLSRDKPNLHTVFAEVKKENAKSRKCFEKCNFVDDGSFKKDGTEMLAFKKKL